MTDDVVGIVHVCTHLQLIVRGQPVNKKKEKCVISSIRNPYCAHPPCPLRVVHVVASIFWLVMYRGSYLQQRAACRIHPMRILHLGTTATNADSTHQQMHWSLTFRCATTLRPTWILKMPELKQIPRDEPSCRKIYVTIVILSG